MGALSIGKMPLGGVLYGVARGVQDAERLGREDEAHQADQAIRTQRLDNEAELQPLRKRALELGVEEGEAAARRRPSLQAMQDELNQLNLDTARMTKKQTAEAYERLQEARRRSDVLNTGLRKFYQSADPQHVVDAVELMTPDMPEENRGAKATRGDDGSITLEIPGRGTQVFRAGKDKAGNARSADDYFGMFAYKMLDPVERLKGELTQEFELQKEEGRTGRALAVARERGAATRYAADARAEGAIQKRSEAWAASQHRQIKGVLDSMLKPESSPSGFAAAYSFDADKALRGMIEEKVENEIEENQVPVRQAARKVIDDVRKGYDTLDKKAKEHAKALAKAKVKPNDRKAVEAAAAQGNADAKELLRVYQVAEKHLGSSVAKYLENQIPAK